MSGQRGKCKFNNNWLDQKKFPEYCEWVVRLEDNRRAGCRLCNTNFDVSNSGVTSLKSHSNSQSHKSAWKTKQSCNIVNSFNKSDVNKKNNTNNNNIDPLVTDKESNKEYQCPHCSQLMVKNSIKNPPSLDKYVTTGDVTRAEIYYCLCQVKKQASTRCFADLSDCFPLMFVDSEIAKKMKIHKDKISYSVTYGLGPYFQEQLANYLRQCKFYSTSFDENLNKIAQKEQMDIIVRFWRNDKVETRYLNSCFLTAATAEDLLVAFKSGITDLGLRLEKILQIALDGPNVNLKFLKDFKSHMSSPDDIDLAQILETGTCSLHIVNGAFKTGHTKTTWELNKYLRSQYFLFKDYPVRRGTYIRITKSSLFPLKFCSIRWTENSNVMTRAREMIPFLKAYVLAVHKKPPETKNFQIVKDFLADKLLDAKLGFMISISIVLEKFLCFYQDPRPLLPFLYSDLYSLHRSLLSRISKKEVMEEVKNASDLMEFDLDKKTNFCLPSKTDIGFIAKNALKNIKGLKETDQMRFYMEAQSFIIELCRKLKEKSPLKYPMTKGASCLSPLVMLAPDAAKIRIGMALRSLQKCNHISDVDCEHIVAEYMTLIEEEKVKRKLNNFDKKKDSLDVFFMELSKECKFSDLLINFVKMILVLFHGNAAVERSFSINKGFLVENLQEASLIAQRCVHDYIMSVGKVTDIKITKDMMTAFQNSSKKRQEALKKNREIKERSETRKRKLAEEINGIKLRKQEALSNLDEKKEEISSYDKRLKKLEQEFQQ